MLLFPALDPKPAHISFITAHLPGAERGGASGTGPVPRMQESAAAPAVSASRTTGLATATGQAKAGMPARASAHRRASEETPAVPDAAHATARGPKSQVTPVPGGVTLDPVRIDVELTEAEYARAVTVASSLTGNGSGGGSGYGCTFDVTRVLAGLHTDVVVALIFGRIRVFCLTSVRLPCFVKQAMWNEQSFTS